jgi:type I pantothenate kinase
MCRARGRISNVTLQRNEANGEGVSPFVELDRQTWSRLADEMEQPLNQEDIVRLRGLGDPLDMKEIREVYLPLSRLLHLYVEAAGQLHAATTTFLG